MKNPPNFPTENYIQFTAPEIVAMCDYEIAVYTNEVTDSYDRGFVDGIKWMRSLFIGFAEEE